MNASFFILRKQTLSAFAVMLTLTSLGNAQSFYVDVTNVASNSQVHLPSGYAYHPSYDFAGAGFSAGSGPFSAPGYGTYHIADGFLTGYTTAGTWQSAWLDVLHPDPDVPPHGGLGTIDIVAPGGIAGAVGLNEAIFGNGLPSAPVGSGDTNNQYLGIGGEPSSGSEYGLWATPIVLTDTTTFEFSYYWSPAGATLADGSEILPLGVVGMGAQFFVLDGTMNYSPLDLAFSENSLLKTYDGAGNQNWFAESGTFTLDPGTYYWGMAATGDSSATYIAVEGMSVTPVPEPAGAFLVALGAVFFALRRRRSA